MQKDHKAVQYITNFDSSTSMLYALGDSLHEKPFKGVGVVPSGLEALPGLLNYLPLYWRQVLYQWSGKWTAISAKMLESVDAEEISKWVIDQYPIRPYPAIMIGSSNGAMIHVAAALGIPWLPQTFLLAVRRQVHPDEMEADIEWGRKQAKIIRNKNPELKINQMHDPMQDRLMVAEMGYFRIKRISLGPVYERFIRENLIPGGSIILIDDRLPWLMMQAGEEHTFQVGGLGALSAREYLEGSPRVEKFLQKEGSSKKSWSLPGPVFEGPESEWGFYPPLGEDSERLAKANNFNVRRVIFEDPEEPSPFVADLYRWWYEKNGVPTKRLLMECFALLQPWMALEGSLVPFWLAFNTETSLYATEAYLKKHSFDEMYLMLMSNGVEGVGQVPIARWKTLLNKAKQKGEFLGVDEKKYPMDFASFMNYDKDLRKKIAAVSKTLPLMTLKELNAFIALSKGNYKTHWE